MNKLPVYISLGAGVQSSAMALMASRGELPDSEMVRGAIFADTQDEPESVYKWLDWLETQLTFPVHRVTAGKLSEKSLTMRVTKDGRSFCSSDIPVYTLSADGSLGKVPNRSCTVDFKIRPILKELRKLAQVKRGTKTPVVEQWIGISIDEWGRAKASRDPWAVFRWPLIEQRFSRSKCLEWMESNGYPKPPRSSCVFCPYHRDSEWRRLQLEEPDAFLRAIEFEKQLQAAKTASDNFDSTPFLHRSCRPLDTIDFRSDVERGQGLLFDDGDSHPLDSWQDECDGMCGV
jgi:hypothetical protein